MMEHLFLIAVVLLSNFFSVIMFSLLGYLYMNSLQYFMNPDL